MTTPLKPNSIFRGMESGWVCTCDHANPLTADECENCQQPRISPSLLAEQAANAERAQRNAEAQEQKDHAEETAFARCGY
jgi:hypothetical protein